MVVEHVAVVGMEDSPPRDDMTARSITCIASRQYQLLISDINNCRSKSVRFISTMYRNKFLISINDNFAIISDDKNGAECNESLGDSRYSAIPPEPSLSCRPVAISNNRIEDDLMRVNVLFDDTLIMTLSTFLEQFSTM